MAKPRQAISSELTRKISTNETVAPSSSSTENTGNWSPAPPSRGSSASAAVHSAAEPKIGNRYHLKPTRQMRMRPRRERTPALPLVAPVTMIAARLGIHPITNSNGNGNSKGKQPSVLGDEPNEGGLGSRSY